MVQASPYGSFVLGFLIAASIGIAVYVLANFSPPVRNWYKSALCNTLPKG